MPELIHILLAANDENDIELTLFALAECRLTDAGEAARDGSEAFGAIFCCSECARRAPELPGVVLLDLKMPRVDALEVPRQIKGNSSLRRLPLAVPTSTRGERALYESESHDLGVKTFVVKRVDFRHYKYAIHAVGAFWAIVNEPPPPVRVNRSILA